MHMKWTFNSITNVGQHSHVTNVLCKQSLDGPEHNAVVEVAADTEFISNTFMGNTST